MPFNVGYTEGVMGVTPSPLNFINQRKNIMKDRREAGKKERNIYI